MTLLPWQLSPTGYTTDINKKSEPRIKFLPRREKLINPWCLDAQQVKVCPGCISETIQCRKWILGRDIGCRCAMSWCELDLTCDFDL